MKTRVAGAAALVLLGSAPALAMSCCGGTEGKAAMCAKGGKVGGNKMRGMTTSRGDAKGGKGCCCEGMADRTSRRG